MLKTHKTPRGLKLASFFLLTGLLFLGVEIMLITQSPLWNPPYRALITGGVIYTLLILPLTYWLTSVKKWALLLTTLLFSTWLLVSIYFGISRHQPSLGFFALFQWAWALFQLIWLKIELNKSFACPNIAWYQGEPRPIPELECTLALEEIQQACKICRIDLNGVFIFIPNLISNLNTQIDTLFEKRKIEVRLKFKENSLSCEGIPVFSLKKGNGGGIQFIPSSIDRRKEIGDFIEKLRGHGYVS